MPQSNVVREMERSLQAALYEGYDFIAALFGCNEVRLSLVEFQ